MSHRKTPPDSQGFWLGFGCAYWGYPLGLILCGFGQRLLKRSSELSIRVRQPPQTSRTLQYAGFWQVTYVGSEGGIDGSNLAYSYVSLPAECTRISSTIQDRKSDSQLQKNVCVIIADTDKTYKFRNFFFTPRPNPLKGIHSLGCHQLPYRQSFLNSKKAQLRLPWQVVTSRQAKR